ncbi:MAG: SDR family NAD(P)-dependent oxidoreductase [Spirochaetota bacterium]|jgi:short-subunit dehydrogenase|nr:SDR family NAD(P)-dependent oxidoreductase [Spirochaetota bacterium]
MVWMRIPGGYALVTGASSGIGRACAKLLASYGEDLILVSRDAAALAQLADELQNEYSISARVLISDLSVPGAARELHKRCHEAGYRIDTLINNAGRGLPAVPQYAQDLDAAVSMLHLNCTNAMELATLCARDMAERGKGRILNVASTAAYQAMPFAALYGASKAFLLSLSEAMHAEMKSLGVIVTAVSPGITDTNFFKYGKPNIPGWLYPLITPGMVARKALSALMRGRPCVIPAFRHWLIARIALCLPRSFMPAIMRQIEIRRKGILKK